MVSLLWPIIYFMKHSSGSRFSQSAKDLLPVHLNEGKTKQNNPLFSVTLLQGYPNSSRWPRSAHCIFVNMVFTGTQTSSFMGFCILMVTFTPHRQSPGIIVGALWPANGILHEKKFDDTRSLGTRDKSDLKKY